MQPTSSDMSGNNVSTNITDEIYAEPALEYLDIVVVVMPALAVVGNGIAVVVLMRCKRIPFQTKYISISLIYSDTLGAFVLIVYQVVTYMFGVNTDVIKILKNVTVGMMY